MHVCDTLLSNGLILIIVSGYSGFKFAEMEMSKSYFINKLCHWNSLTVLFIELVLSVLLETFVFEAEKEFFWPMAGLRKPTLKGSDDLRPQLPLKVSLVQKL